MFVAVCMVIILTLGQSCFGQYKIKETYDDVSYQVAGIFQQDANTHMRAFNESIKYAHLGELRLEPAILEPPGTDSYSVWRNFCADDTIRPIAVFGPQNAITDGAIRDQCTIANIPHIQAAWQRLEPDTDEDIEGTDEEAAEEDEEKIEYKKISINFYPDADELAIAYAKLLKYYNWEGFSVLYEDDFGLLRVQKILAEYTTHYPISVYRLDPNGDNHKIFKQLYGYQESRILLDCHIDRVEKYMNEAIAQNVVNHYQHYVLTTLDASILVEKLTLLECNVTWYSLTDFDNLKNAQHFLAQRVGRWQSDKIGFVPPPVTGFKTESLIIDDISNHLIKALHSIEPGIDDKPITSPCAEDVVPWDLGAKFQNEILKTQSIGVTGNIEFDERGKRMNYTLNINEIHVSERKTIGFWDSAKGDDIVSFSTENDTVGQQSSKHFVIISLKAKPYFYDKQPCEEGEECDEDEKYEGFSVDLVKEIFKVLKDVFKYNYTYSFSDKIITTHGKYNPETKKWTGLIGELLDKKADLAVCDLTITEERKKVVDFSVPILSLGISILYTKDEKVKPGRFSFFYPFSFEVWMYTATAYCVVSIVLFVCSRISPADWENPQPCDKDPEELENIWNFKNCAWLTMGSIMTQGCDILPKAIGSRWVCGMWWFFALIVCQTYIAQLAASMTSALANEPINSVEDLANQNKILYGALNGGSTLEFFRKSKDKMFQRMYDNMMANPAVLVSSNDEGEKRVVKAKKKYAFFMESCTIEYKLKRNCELKKVGDQLDSKDYGIGMPANSPFRSIINRAILKLKELTKLDEIKRKWWEQEYGAQECAKTSVEGDVEGDLEISNLIGIFIVLGVGLAFSLLITAAEFLNEVRNIVVRENVTHKDAFIQELKASLNFFQLQKPVLRNPSRAPSIASSQEKEERMTKRALALDNFLELEKEIQ